MSYPILIYPNISNSILFYSIQIKSILFYSILFYSILFYSIQINSIQFNSIQVLSLVAFFFARNVQQAIFLSGTHLRIRKQCCKTVLLNRNESSKWESSSTTELQNGHGMQEKTMKSVGFVNPHMKASLQGPSSLETNVR